MKRVYEWIQAKLESGGRVEFLTVLLAGAVVTFLVLARSDWMVPGNPNFNMPWDHHKYIYMAESSLFSFHIAPFCWRVGVPFLASHLPFDLLTNFLIITFSGIWLTGVVVYYSAKRFGFPAWYGLVGMFMFYSIGYTTHNHLGDFWMPDAFSLLFTMLALFAILIKNDALFAVLLAVGVTTKEYPLFIVPLYYTLNTKRLLDSRLLLRTVLLALPAVAVLALLRLGIPSLNSDAAYLATLPDRLTIVQMGTSQYSLGWLLQDVGLSRIQNFLFLPKQIYNLTFGPFGLMVALLPFFAFRKNIVLFLRLLPFLALVYLQLLLAVDDRRLIAVGFPAVILLALNGAFYFGGDHWWKRISLLGMGMVMTGLNLLDVYSASAPVEPQAVVFVVWLGLLLWLNRCLITV